jgi:hypothetical protein
VVGFRVQHDAKLPVCVVFGGITHPAPLKFSEYGNDTMHCAYTADEMSKAAIKANTVLMCLFIGANVNLLTNPLQVS